MKRFVFVTVLCVCFGCGEKTISVSNEGVFDNDTVVAEDIVSMLSHNTAVSLKHKVISGCLNFVDVSGDTDYESVYINDPICFVNCVFLDSVRAFDSNRYCVFNKKVCFNQCEFKSGICFRQSDFRDKFRIDLSRIEGKSDFASAVFRGSADFTSVNFMDNALFLCNVFLMDACFRKSLFKRSALFQHSQFANGVSFEDSYFYGYTEFSVVNVGYEADFQHCTFAGNAYFIKSLFLRELILEGCCFRHGLEFQDNITLAKILKDDTAKINIITN